MYYSKIWKDNRAQSIGYVGKYVDRYQGTLESLFIEVISEYPSKKLNELISHKKRDNKEKQLDIIPEVKRIVPKMNKRTSIEGSNTQIQLDRSSNDSEIRQKSQKLNKATQKKCNK